MYAVARINDKGTIVLLEEFGKFVSGIRESDEFIMALRGGLAVATSEELNL